MLPLSFVARGLEANWSRVEGVQDQEPPKPLNQLKRTSFALDRSKGGRCCAHRLSSEKSGWMDPHSRVVTSSGTTAPDGPSDMPECSAAIRPSVASSHLKKTTRTARAALRDACTWGKRGEKPIRGQVLRWRHTAPWRQETAEIDITHACSRYKPHDPLSPEIQPPLGYVTHSLTCASLCPRHDRGPHPNGIKASARQETEGVSAFTPPAAPFAAFPAAAEGPSAPEAAADGGAMPPSRAAARAAPPWRGGRSARVSSPS